MRPSCVWRYSSKLAIVGVYAAFGGVAHAFVASPGVVVEPRGAVGASSGSGKMEGPTLVPPVDRSPCVAAQYQKLESEWARVLTRTGDTRELAEAWRVAKEAFVSPRAMEAAGCRL